MWERLYVFLRCLMKIKCEFCGSYISDTDEKCPNCGAPNANMMRSADGVPKTIEELKAFCAAHNMPLEKMRFFIGVDFREPRAFGIYRDENGDFIVYKNKADGSRAVRYRGKDEAYAVNELYQKLKSEVQIRKAKTSDAPPPPPPAPEPSTPHRRKRREPGGIIAAVIIFIMIIAYAMFTAAHTPDTGYYDYDGGYYYYQDDDWYYYDDALNGWFYASSVDSALREDYRDYYAGDSYSSQYGVENFADSEYYSSSSSSNDDSSWNSDWDSSDFDTDYSSWDSSDTDWSSDW